ncbi:MAG: DHH family phosphoesterase [Oscillospiraceae bacterium]|nr:DHH family phosphoesterase [Oscillospiraceae bacterium]MBQ2384309.1 DHH family phosphoesterase [Oscillospiraceae bacterium]MBQ5711113.1 DHH family phosphoesterase [Oscillospiraceae bacterium]
MNNKSLPRRLQPGMDRSFIVLIVFCALALVFQYYMLAIVEAVLTALFFVYYLVLRARRNKEIRSFIQSTFETLDVTMKAENPFPMVLVRLVDGGIIWGNDKFSTLTGFREKMYEQRLSDVVEGLPTDWLASGRSEYSQDVVVNGRRYRVHGSIARGDDRHSMMMGMMYFTDLTEMYQVRDEYIRSRPVVSIILVDNYEELTMNLSESAISTMNAEINDIITKWAEGYHGLLRKLERNRYLFVFEKRYLEEAQKGKFSVLEDIHQVVNPSGLAASISFGLGISGESFEESYDFAALAIEMALSRGGDQAVIKDRLNFTFYGGRAKEADRRSKVRSRVTANSLMELLGQSSQVFIMGHRNADLDAVGAAMGIACMCRKKGKKAYIVIDLERNAAKRLIAQIQQVPEYRDVFISGPDALLMCDNRSTVVVVDTNRPDQVESKALLEACSRVCVVDHHRRAVDYIDPVVVNLHEPYASSASELVTELLQYSVEKADILPIEAMSLLAGIFLDTKSFNVRTNERTFEAAAVLKRMGADTVEVKKLLQSDFQETMSKYQIMKASRLYHQDIAIAALNTQTTRPLAAQAADELLNISGIAASFVLYPQDGQVIISARSLGDVNVQVILEPLGGGGNAATAGAQVKAESVKEVMDQLLASIDQYYEK